MKKCLLGCMVIFAAVFCVIIIRSWPGFYKRHFAKPEVYFSYVMNQASEQGADLCATMYEELISYIRVSDQSMDLTVGVNLNESILELLSMFLMADMEWIGDTGFSFTYSLKANCLNLGAEVLLGELPLIGADMIYDMNHGNIYVQVPELTDTYIRSDISYPDMEAGMLAMDSLQQLYEQCPDKEELRELIVKYQMLALGCIEEVTRGKGEAEAEGIRQKCMTLTTIIDQAVVERMMYTVLDEMKKDEELYALIRNLAEGMGEEPETMYLEFVEAVAEQMESMQDAFGAGESVRWVLYISGSHRIVGMDVEAAAWELHYAVPVKGTRCAVSVEMCRDGELTSFAGSSSLVGSKMNGRFEWKHNDVSYWEFEVADLNVMSLRKGYVDGIFRISLDDVMNDMLAEYIGVQSIPIDIADYCVELDVETKKNAAQIEIGLIAHEEEQLGFYISYVKGPGREITIPISEECIDADTENALQMWLDGIDWAAYITYLRELGITGWYMDYLEEYIQMNATFFS